MKNHLLHLSILISVLTGCSFKNDQQKTVASYRISSGSVKSSDFDKAKIYDWACLTVQGLGVERTAWVKIDATDPNARSAEFKISNLLGGYSYTFTLLAVDTDNTKLDQTAIKSPCPLRVPEQEGWAQLGQTDVEAPEKASGTFAVEIPFNFYQPIASTPGIPKNFQAVPGNREVNLSWTEPDHDGGAEINQYVIEYSSDQGTVVVLETGTEKTITNLVNNKNYTFRIAAKNSAGQGTFSAAVVATPTGNPLIYISQQPQALSVLEGQSAEFNVAAQLINSNGVLTYQWQRKGSSPQDSFTNIPSETNSSLSLSGVTVAANNGDQYRVVVSAPGVPGVASVTSSVATLTVNSSNTNPLPTAPRNVTVEGVASQEVRLSWISPSNSGGYNILGYKIYCSPNCGNGSSEIDISNIGTNLTFPFPVNMLADNTTYTFQISANTVNGEGPKSAPVRATPYEPTTEAECSAEGTNNNCYAISAPISGNSEIRKGPNNIKIKYEKNLSNIWIWKEVDGNRILNASGEPVKGWQKKLNRSGIGFKTEYFTDINAIGGRVCPVNVFISPGEMIAPRCLYFDVGNAYQTLDKDFSELPDTEAKDWLREWNSTNTGIGAGAGASYYEGNIKTCADKGMRLPTLYEVKLNTTPTSSLLPIGDGIATPVFGTIPGQAVPSVPGDSFTWTASAAPGSETSPDDQQLKKYFGFSLTGGNQELPFWSSAAVRCVLPNNIN